jgi:hypothetical protein
LTENRGFSPRFIYGRRSLPSKNEFKEFDFKVFSFPSKKDFLGIIRLKIQIKESEI